MGEPRKDDPAEGPKGPADESLEAITRGLDAVARERDEILKEIGEHPAPGEERTVEAFRRHAGVARGERATTAREVERRPTSLTFRLLPFAAAAVLVIGCGVLWFLARSSRVEPDEPGGGTLGAADEVELLAPVGAVAEVSVLRWKPIAGAATYRVFLFDSTDPAARRELEQSSQISATEYVPKSPLPARLLWRVQAFDASGAFLAQGEAVAVVERAGSPPR